MSLHAILIVSFDSNSYASAGLGGGERVVIDPAFKHTPKTSLSHHAPLTEIPSGPFQLIKAKPLQIWRLQNLILRSWTWMNRRRRTRTVRFIASIFLIITRILPYIHKSPTAKLLHISHTDHQNDSFTMKFTQRLNFLNTLLRLGINFMNFNQNTQNHTKKKKRKTTAKNKRRTYHDKGFHFPWQD